MIFGIGVGVLTVDRAERVYPRFGERCIGHLLMPEGRALLARSARPVRFRALRSAPEEAIVRSMRTGFTHGLCMRDVGVVQHAWGKPEALGPARGEKVRAGLGIGEGHVTPTDEAGLIVAVAVLRREAA